MSFTESQKNIARLLQKVSPVYQNYFLCRKIFREQFENGYEALICFLENYAYERQGAAAAYSKIALKCVSSKYQNGLIWRVPTRDDAKELWEHYRKIAKSDYNLLDDKTGKAKVNETRNPLTVDGGIIDRLASCNTLNMAVRVRDLISCGDTSGAYNFMTEIRGIGVKIASFYLRDIVYLARLDEGNVSNLHLLQPMDTWLEQTLKILFSCEVPKNLQEKQRLIVNLCRESVVSSISFNQGAWVLGSQIAGEFETFRRALTDHNFAQKVIKNHIKEKEGYLREVKKVRDSLHYAADCSG